MDAAVEVVVSEHPRLGVDGFVAAPAGEAFPAVHALLVVGAEAVVCGVVAAFLSGASGAVSEAGALCAAASGRDESWAVEADAHGDLLRWCGP